MTKHSCCKSACQIYSSAFNPQTGEPLDTQRRRNPNTEQGEENMNPSIPLIDASEEYQYDNLFC